MKRINDIYNCKDENYLYVYIFCFKRLRLQNFKMQISAKKKNTVVFLTAGAGIDFMMVS